MKAIFDGLIVLPNEIVNGHVLMYEKDIWRIVRVSSSEPVCARNLSMLTAVSSFPVLLMNTSTLRRRRRHG